MTTTKRDGRKILFEMDGDPFIHLQDHGLTSKCGVLETNFNVGTEGVLFATCRRCLEAK